MTIHCALLNEADVYLGMADVAPDQVTDRYLTEITECDLEPGRYRWDRATGAFVPLPKPTPDKAVQVPDTLRAIALGFCAVRDSGVTLPEETLNWLAWYSTTVDSQG